jgi:hypothetical protein
MSGNATPASHERTVEASVCFAGVAKALIFQSVSPAADSVLKLHRTILRLETPMKKTEWTREILTTWPSYEYVKQKESAGWRLAAVEWQRENDTPAEARGEAPEGSRFGEEIPFGTRIAGDCLHLEENPSEMEILNCLAEMIVLDLSYPRMAEALNRREFRTREGKPWTPLAVFKLTPRLIEVAPRILSGSEWETRKKQLSRVAWNS